MLPVFFALPLEQIRAYRPLDVINGIEVDLHEGAEVVVAVPAEIVLITDPFVIRRVELRQKLRPVIKVLGSAGAKGKTPELCLNIGGGSYVR